MSERASAELLSPTATEHAATRAWLALGARQIAPLRVTALRVGAKTAVFRLHGAAPDGGAVIAKRSRPAVGAVERLVYEEVLPDCFVGTLRYHGSIEDAGASWIFIEDAGRAAAFTATPQQRLVAARWLARLHAAMAGHDFARRLPDAGPARYLTQLRSARETIRLGLDNPAISRDDVPLLSSIVSQLDRVESRWEHAVDACAAVRATLVHGDLQPKNLRVRGRVAALLVMDWETAGWGAPSVDLAFLHAIDRDGGALAAYHDAAQGGGGIAAELDPVGLRRLIDIGAVFRCIAAMEWNVAGLATSWPRRAVACARIHHAALADAMRRAAWTR